MGNKIAVLVCGYYREFDIAVQSWKPLMEFDFYVSTWNVSKQNTAKWTYECVDFDVTENMIRDYIPHATIDVMDYSNHGDMITHWKNALRLCKESGITYDKIIVIRPDLFIRIDINNLKNNYNDNGILWGKSDDSNWFEDMFFLGTSETVTTFIEGLKINDGVTDPHGILSRIVKSLGMTHLPMYGDLDYAILRPNIRLINKNIVDLPKAKIFELYFVEVYNRNKQ